MSIASYVELDARALLQRADDVSGANTDKPPAVEIDLMRALRARFRPHDFCVAIGALVADVNSLGDFSQPPINIVQSAGVAVDAAAAIVEVLRRAQAISQAPEAPHGRLQ